MPAFGITYDMWCPPFADTPPAAQYAAMLDQIEYVDEHGWAMVSFNEHHRSKDGYLPSPLIATAAVAARTRQIALRPLLLLPFYETLKLAEDLAVVDLISGGRLAPVFGAGYRAEEFEMFDKDLADRRSTIDEAVQALRTAWTGEPFEYRGRTVQIMPRPAQRPAIPIFLGGSSKAAARAAARLADGFYPTEARWWEVYREELEKLGRSIEGGPPARGGPMFLHVSEDPDRDWPLITPYLLNAIHQYREWTFPNMKAMGKVPPQFSVESEEDLRASNHYVIVTPDECVDLLAPLGAGGLVTIRPGWGGYSPELGWSCLRLLVENVIPRLDALEAQAVGAPVAAS